MQFTKVISLFTVVFLLVTISLKGNSLPVHSDSITVYIFLHDACVISQYYTLPLRALHQEYANEQIQFIGLFPNFSAKPNNIKTFKKKYNIPFDLRPDYYHTQKEALGATVTPEVVVYNETKAQILYRGRIDDSYARVGQRKRVTTSAELKQVLEAIQTNQPIQVSNTEAVGCFIGKDKLY